MNPNSPLITLLIFLTATLTLPSPTSSQTCKRSCGDIPIRYPFGTGSGCGDPRFEKHVTCDQSNSKLTLTTHTGCYPVTNIDYTNQVVYVSDPSMSTCSCTQRSRGFGLDWDAPFSFHDDTVFTLLDCSTSASPIFRTSSDGGNYSNNSSGGGSNVVPQCDRTGAPICSFLYSCRAISMLDLPISTCCVYAPVDLGPAFEMDLGKLKCSSYSGFYSFNGQEPNPESWKYGIALKYKFSVYNDYPVACVNCERSNGACGYDGDYNTFVCNCGGGFNTTSDCFFVSAFNHGPRPLPWRPGTWLIYIVSGFLGFIFW